MVSDKNIVKFKKTKQYQELLKAAGIEDIPQKQTLNPRTGNMDKVWEQDWMGTYKIRSPKTNPNKYKNATIEYIDKEKGLVKYAGIKAPAKMIPVYDLSKITKAKFRWATESRQVRQDIGINLGDWNTIMADTAATASPLTSILRRTTPRYGVDAPIMPKGWAPTMARSETKREVAKRLYGKTLQKLNSLEKTF